MTLIIPSTFIKVIKSTINGCYVKNHASTFGGKADIIIRFFIFSYCLVNFNVCDGF